jgi:hypothetical protein
VLGHVGDRAPALAASAMEAAASGDVCVLPEVAARLAAVEDRRLRRHLAALDAVRVMTMSTNAPWQVCGLGFSLLDDAEDDVPAGRSDLLVLASPRDHVLYDVASRRAFRVDRAVGQVLEVVLTSRDEGVAAERLERAQQHADPVVSICTVRDAFATRGIDLSPTIAQAAHP